MIRVDYRERGSGVIQALERNKTRLEVRALKTGDYVVDGHIFVERKTSRDFIVSLKTGRLFRQISELKKHGQRQLLIIEGLPLTLIGGASPRAITGALVAITVSWQLPILYSECPEETAEILSRIEKQIIKGEERRPRKIYWRRKSRRPPAQKKKILESMPMIGPSLAGELLDNFGTLEKVFMASEKDLTGVKGIGKKKAVKIRNILQEEKAQYVSKTILFSSSPPGEGENKIPR